MATCDPKCAWHNLGFILAQNHFHSTQFGPHTYIIQASSCIFQSSLSVPHLSYCIHQVLVYIPQFLYFNPPICTLHCPSYIFAYLILILNTLAIIWSVLNIILNLHSDLSIVLYCLAHCDINLDTIAPKIVLVSTQIPNRALKLPTTPKLAPTTPQAQLVLSKNIWQSQNPVWTRQHFEALEVLTGTQIGPLALACLNLHSAPHNLLFYSLSKPFPTL